MKIKLLFVSLLILLSFYLFSINKKPIDDGRILYRGIKARTIDDILEKYSEDEILNIKDISIFRSDIGSLFGIEKIENLEGILITNSNLENIKNLSRLLKIKHIDLSNNKGSMAWSIISGVISIPLI